MIRNKMLAGAAAGVFAAFLVGPAANAVPLPNSGTAQQGLVEQVKRGPGGGGGGHFRGGGGGGPRFHGGGGGPRFHGGGGGGPRFHGNHGHGPRHFHGPRGPRHFHGPRFRGGYFPYAYGYGAYSSYYFDDYGGYADCAPLRRRAMQSGKRYWWNRYYACIDG